MVFQHNGVRFRPRKIDLPASCCPMDFQTVKKGDPNCDHDFPPENKDDSKDRCIHWTCSKCDFEICYGLWD